MSNPLSSLGLTIDNMTSLGFTGTSAAALFSPAAVNAFVSDLFSGQTLPTTSGNAADAFDFAVNADKAIATAGGTFSYTDYLNQVNSILANSTGGSLSDLNYTLGADGTFTGTYLGSSNSVNILDLMNQAIEIALG